MSTEEQEEAELQAAVDALKAARRRFLAAEDGDEAEALWATVIELKNKAAHAADDFAMAAI
jgi:hypothetical protein